MPRPRSCQPFAPSPCDRSARQTSARRLGTAAFGRGGETGERQGGELLAHLLHAEAALRVVPFVEPVQHSQEAVGRDLNVELGAELAALDAFADDPLPATFVFFWREANHFAEAALYRL